MRSVFFATTLRAVSDLEGHAIATWLARRAAEDAERG